MQKDSTLSKLAAMEGAVPKQLQPTFKKVIQKLQQVAVTSHPSSICPSVHRLSPTLPIQYSNPPKPPPPTWPHPPHKAPSFIPRSMVLLFICLYLYLYHL